MELQEISRDAVNSRLRDKSAIYKNIPMTHNKNIVAVMKKLEYIRYQNKYMELRPCKINNLVLILLGRRTAFYFYFLLNLCGRIIV